MTLSRITLTANGPEFSRLAFGVWRLGDWGLDRAGLRTLLDACVDLGLTTIDHADIYGGYTCEAEFGEVLKGESALRDRLQLVSKCGIKLVSPKRPSHKLHSYDTSKAHIIASAENSLRMLHTDRLDLLLIHRPDPLLDADEVAEAFSTLHQAGKVLHFGVSNFTPAQWSLLASRLDLPLVTNQIELSVLHLDPLHDGTLDYCQQLRVPPMAWSPLGGGNLFRSDDARALRVRAALAQVGAEHNGAALDQIALAWLLRHPAQVLPVLGTGSLERIKGAVAADQLRLTREQWFTIWEASAGHEVP